MRQEILDKIKDYCLASHPNEACGFVLDSGEVVNCENIYDGDKRNHYKINEIDCLKASRQGKILYIFHSHTSQAKRFSITDMIISEEFGYKQILYHTPDDSFLFYEPCGYQNPYIGKLFKWGKYDCFSIVKLYYRNELGIELDEQIKSRDASFFDIYEDLFGKDGFLQIAHQNNLIEAKNEPPKMNDILLFKNVENNRVHFGIYVDDDSFLHVPMNGYSKISQLIGEFKNNLYTKLRLKDK